MTGSAIKTDVLIIGGGPAGATSAIRLLQRGIRPLIIEREQFPRYHIGEALTGEGGALLRELGFEQQMLDARYAVKHGVRVFGSSGNPNWWVPVMQRTPDLELHDQWTWSMWRDTFDKMLLDDATTRGAELLHGRATAPLMSDDGGTLRGAKVRVDDGSEIDIEAEITLDCTGQSTFLANRGVTGPKYLGSYDKQIAVFSQVANYQRDNGEREFAPGNTHIFYKRKFHWAWAIPLDDDIQSIGIVIPAKYFRESGESKSDFVRREIRELNQGLSDRVPEAKLIDEPHVIPNYSFQVRRFAGHGFICVGDSHRFVDPIFSFGLYIALKEGGLVADQVERWLAGEMRDDETPFRDYMIHTERAIDTLEDMIDTFWESPVAFSVFVNARYRDPLLDMFAGRIYDGMPAKRRDEAVLAFWRMLDRERTYDSEDDYSVPIGSRFHPERAPLWNSSLDSVETTEQWIRDNS